MREEVAIIPGMQSVEHRLVVKTGAVLMAIQELVEKQHIDLIVCASHGASGFEKAVIGSTAERILHYVSCPVLVVGPECLVKTLQMDSILLCTNLTPGCYRPAQYATSLAQEHNASLTVVHAVPIHRYVLDTPLRLRLRMKVKELLPANIESWSHLKIVIVRGEVADSILPIAQREKSESDCSGNFRRRGSCRSSPVEDANLIDSSRQMPDLGGSGPSGEIITGMSRQRQIPVRG